MNTDGLQGINIAENGNQALEKSNLGGLFSNPPTYSTFIDGYYERFTPIQPLSDNIEFIQIVADPKVLYFII